MPVRPAACRLSIAQVAGAAVAGLALALAPAASAEAPLIVPQPSHWTPATGDFTVQDGVSLVTSGGAGEGTATYLRDLVRRTRGIDLKLSRAGTANAIVLKRVGDPSLGAEGYRLRVDATGVTVTATTDAGLFYGATSLWQMITQDGAPTGPATLSGGVIIDQPRFAWRGLMIDSARHFQSPDEIRRMIDVMALHKLNVLHWHLTDDQGWRLQIRAYPRLTQVGAFRVPAAAPGTLDLDPATGDPRLYGGFYTQQEAREIVAYAAARHVAIVPEIELPGHALAAILAYPQLGAGKASASTLGDWGVFPNAYNADEATFAFLQTVLSEVMEIFPGQYIHVGGDEVVKDQWVASPSVQARMRELGIYDEQALHGYFTSRIGAFLQAHGRRLIGWDEVLEGPLPNDAAVMSWRGMNGAVTAIRNGHDAVMSPAPILYFDNRQSDARDEPPGRAHVVSLRDVYDFDPMPAELKPEERSHLLGLQANLWTEHIRTSDRLEHMAFPRAAAVAEIGWSAGEGRDWQDFVRRLQPWAARYRALGVNAADSAFKVRVRADVDPWTRRAAVTMANQAVAGEIRYTLDGSAPTAASSLYREPLVTALPVRVQAAAFLDGRALAPATDAPLSDPLVRRRYSQELKACGNKIPISLEDDAPASGPRAVFLVDVMSPCWIYPDADLSDVTTLVAAVGQLPFNFQIGVERDRLALAKPATPEGELEVRLDTCDGERIAAMPLAPAAANPAVTELSASIKPRAGRHDLCFSFTRPAVEPLWAIDWVQPTPQAFSAATSR